MWLLPEQARGVVEACGLRAAPEEVACGHVLEMEIEPSTATIRVDLRRASAAGAAPARAAVAVDPRERMGEWHARELLAAAGLGTCLCHATATLGRLADAFVDHEMLYLEVEVALAPASVYHGSVRALCDENAAFRNERVAALVAAAKPEAAKQLKLLGIDYVELDGAVGLISVGAGETLAVMDLLAEAGCPAACFLDVSGGFGVEAMTAAFRQVAKLPRLRAVLVNVFGGLTRVDQVGESILAALDALGGSRAPLVIRLEGTDADRGRRLVEARGLHGESTLRGAIAAVVGRASGGPA